MKDVRPVSNLSLQKAGYLLDNKKNCFVFLYCLYYCCFFSRNNKKDLVERLWSMINSRFWYDSRLRCDMVDLYYTLYGRRKPFCLGGVDLGLLTANQLMPGSHAPMPNWNNKSKVSSFTLVHLI